MEVLRIASDGARNESRNLFLRPNFQRPTQFRPSLAQSGKGDSTGTSVAEDRQNILTSCGIPLLLSRTLTNVSDPGTSLKRTLESRRPGVTSKAVKLQRPASGHRVQSLPKKDMAAGKPTYQELTIASGAGI